MKRLCYTLMVLIFTLSFIAAFDVAYVYDSVWELDDLMKIFFDSIIRLQENSCSTHNAMKDVLSSQ